MPIETPRSQYRQVADLLRAAIESGEYGPDSVLPAETELAALHGVSRQTVNKAVSILRSEGLVRVERGRGTTVRKIPTIHRASTARYQQTAREDGGGRGAFDTEIKALGMTPRSDTEVSTVPAPPEVAEALGLAEGDPVVLRLRRMYANDVPVQRADSWIPGEIAEGTPLAEVDSGPGGIISRFAELGHAQTRITESVRVRRATDEEQSFLQLEEEQFVIEIWHTGWTADDRPVELAIHSVPAHLWVLDYGWPIG